MRETAQEHIERISEILDEEAALTAIKLKGAILLDTVMTERGFKHYTEADPEGLIDGLVEALCRAIKQIEVLQEQINE